MIKAPTFKYDDTADDGGPDGAALWEELRKKSELKLSQATRPPLNVYFDRGPVCISHMADLHLPNTGVDITMLERDLAFVRETPGVFVAFAGDMVDNFVVGRLARLQMFASFTVDEQWAILKHGLSLVPKEKMLWMVSGNHDDWTISAAGVDYLQDVTLDHLPRRAYAKSDMRTNVWVGDHMFKFRIRHKFKGSSIYNPTHGQERLPKFDGEHYDVIVGAHTHVSALAREFTHDGVTSYALQCGSYKIDDEYAVQLGVPRTNGRAAVYTILHEDGGVLATSSLSVAKAHMARAHDGKEHGRTYNGID